MEGQLIVPEAAKKFKRYMETKAKVLARKLKRQRMECRIGMRDLK